MSAMLIAAAACALVLAAPVRAESGTDGEDEGETGATSWFDWEHATGDWGGVRPALVDRGIEVEFSLTSVWQANHKGGISSQPAGKFTVDYDLELTLDTERLGLWPGGRFVVLAEGSKGTGIDERYVGSLIGVNDDAGDYSRHHAKVTEYFYEHRFVDEALSVRTGILDGGRDFEANDYADEYASSLVATDRVPFPDFAPGVQMMTQPTDWLSAAVIALRVEETGCSSIERDVEFSGGSDWFFAGEIGLAAGIPGGEAGDLPGHVRTGIWHDTVRYTRLDNERRERGAQGVYVSVDQVIFREPQVVEADDDEEPNEDEEWIQGVGVFFRYSYIGDDFTEIEHLWHAGTQYTGLIPGRDHDALGVCVAMAELGAPAAAETRYDRETLFEAWYTLCISDAAAVTFDLQYVQHPGADGPSSLVPGIKLEVDL